MALCNLLNGFILSHTQFRSVTSGLQDKMEVYDKTFDLAP